MAHSINGNISAWHAEVGGSIPPVSRARSVSGNTFVLQTKIRGSIPLASRGCSLVEELWIWNPSTGVRFLSTSCPHRFKLERHPDVIWGMGVRIPLWTNDLVMYEMLNYKIFNGI